MPHIRSLALAGLERRAGAPSAWRRGRAWSTWRPRARARAPAGTSSVMTEPGGDERAVADGDRGDQRGVRADEGAGADLGPVLEDAVVVAGDGAGADVGAARRRGRRRDRSGGWPWRPRSTMAFLISTKLPTWTSSAISAPGRRRAKGPMLAPRLTWQPSRWQKAWIVGAGLDGDAGAEDDVRADRRRRGR